MDIRPKTKPDGIMLDLTQEETEQLLTDLEDFIQRRQAVGIIARTLIERLRELGFESFNVPRVA